MNEETSARLAQEALNPNNEANNPEVVFECLWDNCDWQFDDLNDLIEHCVTEPNGHVQQHFVNNPGTVRVKYNKFHISIAMTFYLYLYKCSEFVVTLQPPWFQKQSTSVNGKAASDKRKLFLRSQVSWGLLGTPKNSIFRNVMAESYLCRRDPST